MDSEVSWLDPWWPVAEERPDLAAAYEAELRAELGDNHPLLAVPIAAVAKHDGSDDVLFRLLDGTGRVAVVHLTWARHPEPAPWPGCTLYDDLASFAKMRMRQDHEDFAS